jgi:hypothetical protein
MGGVVEEVEGGGTTTEVTLGEMVYAVYQLSKDYADGLVHALLPMAWC